jgi:uncharacterized CHY-type Zn-finger protein
MLDNQAKPFAQRKLCPKCNIELEHSNFHKNRARSDGLAVYCSNCSKFWAREQYKKTKAENYIRVRWNAINNRCYNKSHNKYKYYGGKGINNWLTISDLKFLWIRDNASSLMRPSIDRVDSKGDYTLANCRFIELSENRKRKS